jgi:hypothetical protein
MTLRLGLRALATQPVRSAVLAAGFGFGIAVMAALLGVGEVILDQARSPALAGGGDVRVIGLGGSVGSARFVLSSVLAASPLAARVAAASPAKESVLYLVEDEGALAVLARGGIPSLERAVGDPETAPVVAWVDGTADLGWAAPDPAEVLRAMDRFHPVPDAPEWAGSWAEWLYFNGRAGGARFYLTFLVGAPRPSGERPAGVRLQLERDGRLESFSDRGQVTDRELLDGAPDLAVGRNRVWLEGLRYRITLDLRARGTGRLTGEVTLDATPGHALPPFTVRGARGWLTGYTVPVLSGRLGGALHVNGQELPLAGGEGYHDHNWGFWHGVTWQWGQVAHEDLSIVFGRIRPPEEAADPERLPGFLAVLGPDGALGFSTDVRIDERDDPRTSEPARIEVQAEGTAISLRLGLAIEHVIRTPLDRGQLGGSEDTGARGFLQLRAGYHVEGRVGARSLRFDAPGSAETFR